MGFPDFPLLMSIQSMQARVLEFSTSLSYFQVPRMYESLQDGHLEKSLKGHGHWVNTLALSTEAALRTGAFDHTGSAPSEPEEAQAKALQRCAPAGMAPRHRGR